MQDNEQKDIIVEVDNDKIEIVDSNTNKDNKINEEKNVDLTVEPDKNNSEILVEAENKTVEVSIEQNNDESIKEVKPEVVSEPAKEGKRNKKKNKKKDKSESTIVEVSNIPTEVVTAKESKKSKKISNFFAFATIILALVFTIVDWTVESVTKNHNPQIVLHLMDWISILLYITLAIKALPFLAGKKKWVKILFWICVIATLVCIIVPMVLDYVELANAIQKAQQDKTQQEQVAAAIRMFI